MLKNIFCPNCGAAQMSFFYKLNRIPVNSVILMRSCEEACNLQIGDVTLGFCSTCGFISNTAFDSALLEYSTEYESTQSFSPTFNAFHHELATHFIDRYELRDKDIIEIGCGQGEFLTLICNLGRNRGIGFDPAYREHDSKDHINSQIRFIADYYSEKYASVRADFICCKMTLEHIFETKTFISMIRRSIGDQSDTVVFFQVPDATRIIQELAFWDIHYEHCSYFTPVSLSFLFQNCGFEVLDLWRAYDDQYLIIEAIPTEGKITPVRNQERNLERLKADVDYFESHSLQKIKRWRNELIQIKANGERTVIWGSSSKTTAFLSTLGIKNEIDYVVDINPYRQETYMPQTGQKIVAPKFLKEYRPDVIIVISPVYLNEIQKELERLGVNAKLVTPQQ